MKDASQVSELVEKENGDAWTEGENSSHYLLGVPDILNNIKKVFLD